MAGYWSAFLSKLHAFIKKLLINGFAHSCKTMHR
jgi:hypothetical protein